MPRIRSIKPDFWTDYKLAEDLTRDQRLFYIGLWNEADDQGRFLAHPRRLLGAIFPYDRDLTESFIEDSLRALAETGRLVLYELGGEPYGELTKFSDHQRVNRPSPSRIPPPPAVSDGSVRTHGALSEASTPHARAPEVELGARSREMEQDPPGVAHAREPIEPEDAVVIDDEEPPEVPGDTGARVVPFRPRELALPFAGHDWEGRVSGSVVLQEWISRQPTPPAASDRNRFGRAAKQIADEHTTGEIALAFIGMGYLWPFGDPKTGKEREPWTPEDLRRVFAKALPAARNHPELKRQEFAREFAAAEGAPW